MRDAEFRKLNRHLDPPFFRHGRLTSGQTGLSNPHFWCFFNAAVQCFRFTPGLNEALKKAMSQKRVKKPKIGSILSEFLDLVDLLESGEYVSMKPSRLFAALHNKEVFSLGLSLFPLNPNLSLI